jgi:hypothetical protein
MGRHERAGVCAARTHLLIVQVLFFVPSTALVDQQTKSLACYLRRVCTVHGLSGSDMIKSAFVHTPCVNPFFTQTSIGRRAFAQYLLIM